MKARDIIEALDPALKASRKTSDWRKILHAAVNRFVKNAEKRFGIVQAVQHTRNHNYEIRIGVYEHGNGYKMTPRHIKAALKQAADIAHPRLFRQMRVDVPPYTRMEKSGKVGTLVRIFLSSV